MGQRSFCGGGRVGGVRPGVKGALRAWEKSQEGFCLVETRGMTGFAIEKGPSGCLVEKRCQETARWPERGLCPPKLALPNCQTTGWNFWTRFPGRLRAALGPGPAEVPRPLRVWGLRSLLSGVYSQGGVEEGGDSF